MLKKIIEKLTIEFPESFEKNDDLVTNFVSIVQNQVLEYILNKIEVSKHEYIKIDQLSIEIEFDDIRSEIKHLTKEEFQSFLLNNIIHQVDNNFIYIEEQLINKKHNLLLHHANIIIQFCNTSIIESEIFDVEEINIDKILEEILVSEPSYITMILENLISNPNSLKRLVVALSPSNLQIFFRYLSDYYKLNHKIVNQNLNLFLNSPSYTNLTQLVKLTQNISFGQKLQIDDKKYQNSDNGSIVKIIPNPINENSYEPILDPIGIDNYNKLRKLLLENIAFINFFAEINADNKGLPVKNKLINFLESKKIEYSRFSEIISLIYNFGIKYRNSLYSENGAYFLKNFEGLACNFSSITRIQKNDVRHKLVDKFLKDFFSEEEKIHHYNFSKINYLRQICILEKESIVNAGVDFDFKQNSEVMDKDYLDESIFFDNFFNLFLSSSKLNSRKKGEVSVLSFILRQFNSQYIIDNDLDKFDLILKDLNQQQLTNLEILIAELVEYSENFNLNNFEKLNRDSEISKNAKNYLKSLSKILLHIKNVVNQQKHSSIYKFQSSGKDNSKKQLVDFEQTLISKETDNINITTFIEKNIFFRISSSFSDDPIVFTVAKQILVSIFKNKNLVLDFQVIESLKNLDSDAIKKLANIIDSVQDILKNLEGEMLLKNHFDENSIKFFSKLNMKKILLELESMQRLLQQKHDLNLVYKESQPLGLEGSFGSSIYEKIAYYQNNKELFLEIDEENLKILYSDLEFFTNSLYQIGENSKIEALQDVVNYLKKKIDNIESDPTFSTEIRSSRYFSDIRNNLRILDRYIFSTNEKIINDNLSVNFNSIQKIEEQESILMKKESIVDENDFSFIDNQNNIEEDLHLSIQNYENNLKRHHIYDDRQNFALLLQKKGVIKFMLTELPQNKFFNIILESKIFSITFIKFVAEILRQSDINYFRVWEKILELYKERVINKDDVSENFFIEYLNLEFNGYSYLGTTLQADYKNYYKRKNDDSSKIKEILHKYVDASDNFIYENAHSILEEIALYISSESDFTEIYEENIVTLEKILFVIANKEGLNFADSYNKKFYVDLLKKIVIESHKMRDNSFDVESKNTPLSQFKENKSHKEFAIQDRKQYIVNGGIVFLWPFIPELLSTLGFIDKNYRFANSLSVNNAIHVLNFCVTGKLSTFEWCLSLPKIVCGLDVEDTVYHAFQPEFGTLPSWLEEHRSTWQNYVENNELSYVEQQIYKEIVEIRDIVDKWIIESLKKWESLERILDLDDFLNDTDFVKIRSYLFDRLFTFISNPQKDFYYLEIPFKLYDSEDILPEWFNQDCRLPWMQKKMVHFWI